ncbi:MAG: hypothetical protein ACK2U9_14445, partial [Anaerolineae bacterium]
MTSGTEAILSLSLLALAIGIATHALLRAPAPSVPRLGRRGERRRKTMAGGGTFRLVEPFMRVAGGWIAGCNLGRTRERIEAQLLRAGDYLGISADELIALSGLSALLFAAFGAVFSRLLQLGLLFVFMGLVLG